MKLSKEEYDALSPVAKEAARIEGMLDVLDGRAELGRRLGSSHDHPGPHLEGGDERESVPSDDQNAAGPQGYLVKLSDGSELRAVLNGSGPDRPRDGQKAGAAQKALSVGATVVEVRPISHEAGS